MKFIKFRKLRKRKFRKSRIEENTDRPPPRAGLAFFGQSKGNNPHWNAIIPCGSRISQKKEKFFRQNLQICRLATWKNKLLYGYLVARFHPPSSGFAVSAISIRWEQVSIRLPQTPQTDDFFQGRKFAFHEFAFQAIVWSQCGGALAFFLNRAISPAFERKNQTFVPSTSVEIIPSDFTILRFFAFWLSASRD